jgi:hypothetical protein
VPHRKERVAVALFRGTRRPQRQPAESLGSVGLAAHRSRPSIVKAPVRILIRSTIGGTRQYGTRRAFCARHLETTGILFAACRLKGVQEGSGAFLSANCRVPFSFLGLRGRRRSAVAPSRPPVDIRVRALASTSSALSSVGLRSAAPFDALRFCQTEPRFCLTDRRWPEIRIGARLARRGNEAVSPMIKPSDTVS